MAPHARTGAGYAGLDWDVGSAATVTRPRTSTGTVDGSAPIGADPVSDDDPARFTAAAGRHSEASPSPPAPAGGALDRREPVHESRWTLSGSLVDNRPPSLLALFMVIVPALGTLFGVWNGGVIQYQPFLSTMTLSGVYDWLVHSLSSFTSLGHPGLYVASIVVSFAEISRRR